MLWGLGSLPSARNLGLARVPSCTIAISSCTISWPVCIALVGTTSLIPFKKLSTASILFSHRWGAAGRHLVPCLGLQFPVSNGLVTASLIGNYGKGWSITPCWSRWPAARATIFNPPCVHNRAWPCCLKHQISYSCSRLWPVGK